jgi:hypothetical protein
MKARHATLPIASAVPPAWGVLSEALAIRQPVATVIWHAISHSADPFAHEVTGIFTSADIWHQNAAVLRLQGQAIAFAQLLYRLVDRGELDPAIVRRWSGDAPHLFIHGGQP